MPKTAGATSFLTIPLSQLQKEVDDGHIKADEIVVGKTWYEKIQFNKIRKGYSPTIGGSVGAANVPVIAAPVVNGGAPAEGELKKDDTPLEDMEGISVD